MTLFSRLFRKRPKPRVVAAYYVGKEHSFAFMEEPTTMAVLKVLELDYPSELGIMEFARKWATLRGYSVTFRKLNRG